MLAHRRTRLLAVAPILAIAFAVSAPSHARVEISLDAATLTEFLKSVAPPSVAVSLPSGATISLELSDLRVLGFEPGAGKAGKGQLHTSLRLGVPALGIDLPVEPRLSLDVQESQGQKICVLRFERLPIPLPMTGSIDLSPLLPVIRVPAESAFVLSLNQGNVRVKSRLIDTKMGTEALRLAFNLEMEPETASVRTRK